MRVWVKKLYFKVTKDGLLDLPEVSDFEGLEGVGEERVDYCVYEDVCGVRKDSEILYVRRCPLGFFKKMETIMTGEALMAIRSDIIEEGVIGRGLDMRLIRGSEVVGLGKMRVPVIYDDLGLVRIRGGWSLPRVGLEYVMGLGIIVDERLPFGFTFVDRRRGDNKYVERVEIDYGERILPCSKVVMEHFEGRI